MSAGYSGTPLARKLGIKPGARVLLLGAPEGCEAWLAPLPEGVQLLRRARQRVDVILAFATTPAALRQRLAAAVRRLRADGGLWIGWPKQRRGADSRLAFDLVQRAGLATGLVDNKICAIDDTWSGLRFVVRREDRPNWPTDGA